MYNCYVKESPLHILLFFFSFSCNFFLLPCIFKKLWFDSSVHTAILFLYFIYLTIMLILYFNGIFVNAVNIYPAPNYTKMCYLVTKNVLSSAVKCVIQCRKHVLAQCLFFYWYSSASSCTVEVLSIFKNAFSVMYILRFYFTVDQAHQASMPCLSYDLFG